MTSWLCSNTVDTNTLLRHLLPGPTLRFQQRYSLKSQDEVELIMVSLPCDKRRMVLVLIMAFIMNNASAFNFQINGRMLIQSCHPLNIQKSVAELQKDEMQLHIKKRSSSVLLRNKENDEDGDDGWGVSTEKEKELAALRSQISSKSDSNSGMSSSSSSSTSGEEGQRDLFIPIFAVVSLLGLFGAYGYEMLRLYSRGELYLPGM